MPHGQVQNGVLSGKARPKTVHAEPLCLYELNNMGPIGQEAGLAALGCVGREQHLFMKL